MSVKYPAEVLALVRQTVGLSDGDDDEVLLARLRDLVVAEKASKAQLDRREALRDVMDMWAQHRLGEDPLPENLVVLAHWLWTGDPKLVVDLQARWREQIPAPVSSDAATWSVGIADNPDRL